MSLLLKFYEVSKRGYHIISSYHPLLQGIKSPEHSECYPIEPLQLWAAINRTVQKSSHSGLNNAILVTARADDFGRSTRIWKQCYNICGHVFNKIGHISNVDTLKNKYIPHVHKFKLAQHLQSTDLPPIPAVTSTDLLKSIELQANQSTQSFTSFSIKEVNTIILTADALLDLATYEIDPFLRALSDITSDHCYVFILGTSRKAKLINTVQSMLTNYNDYLEYIETSWNKLYKDNQKVNFDFYKQMTEIDLKERMRHEGFTNIEFPFNNASKKIVSCTYRVNGYQLIDYLKQCPKYRLLSTPRRVINSESLNTFNESPLDPLQALRQCLAIEVHNSTAQNCNSHRHTVTSTKELHWSNQLYTVDLMLDHYLCILDNQYNVITPSIKYLNLTQLKA